MLKFFSALPKPHLAIARARTNEITEAACEDAATNLRQHVKTSPLRQHVMLGSYVIFVCRAQTLRCRERARWNECEGECERILSSFLLTMSLRPAKAG